MRMQDFIRRRKKIEWILFPSLALFWVFMMLQSAFHDSSIIRGRLSELSCEDYSSTEESTYIHTVRLIGGREYWARTKTVECWALLEHPSDGQEVEVEIYPRNKFLNVTYDGRPIYPDRILEEHLELRSTERFASIFWCIALLLIYLRDRKEVHSKFKKLLRKLTTN